MAAAVSEPGEHMNPFERGLRPVRELGARRPHGDRLRYLSGCKCFHCRRANGDYERKRQLARRSGDWNGIVSAARARAHLQKLSRLGVGRRAVSDVTDISDSVLHEIRKGRRRNIRARTERKILAVGVDHKADGATVSARATWRKLRALLAEGFTAAELARRMGYRHRALQFNRSRVTVRNEQRVRALYSRFTI